MTKIELLTKLTELLKENRKSVEDRERLTHNRLTGPLSNRLALFGIGGLGRRTLRGLRNAGVEPLAFCDNNKRLWGHKVEGLKVLPPKQAVKTLANKASFIVTIWNRSEGHPLHSVEAQLNLHGKAIVASFIPLYWKYEEFFLSYFFVR